MKIAIVGAGAMGSIFGSMLSSVSDVFLIDHNPANVNAIKRDGLKIENIDGSTKTYQIFVSADPSDINVSVDAVIIFTKSYETENAAISARPLLGQNGVVLTLQNGLGNIDIIEKVAGKKSSVAGVTSHGGTQIGPGYVRHAGTGPTYIAGSKENAKQVKNLADTFNAAGIETTISDNIESLIWGKLIINVGINAMAAIIRVQNGILGIKPECEKIMSKAVSEAVAVSEALDIKLPYDNPLKQVKKVCENTAKNRASMLQDILKGARTEVSVINRAIVARGNETGIETPYNLFLSEIIEALEATSEYRI